MSDKISIRKHLNRVEGQIRGISRMIDEERDCLDIVQQVVAVRASLATIGVNILQSDMGSCIKRDRSEEFDKKMAQLFKLS
jgi:DNA-binding FrmR family transcriptional regulator